MCSNIYVSTCEVMTSLTTASLNWALMCEVMTGLTTASLNWALMCEVTTGLTASSLNRSLLCVFYQMCVMAENPFGLHRYPVKCLCATMCVFGGVFILDFSLR